MSKMGTPVKVVKAGDKSISSAKTESAVVAAVAGKKIEPEAQLVEVESGVYDITFTCSCGERTVLRCHSLDNSSKPTVTPTPPPPAKLAADIPSQPPSPSKPIVAAPLPSTKAA